MQGGEVLKLYCQVQGRESACEGGQGRCHVHTLRIRLQQQLNVPRVDRLIEFLKESLLSNAVLNVFPLQVLTADELLALVPGDWNIGYRAASLPDPR